VQEHYVLALAGVNVTSFFAMDVPSTSPPPVVVPQTTPSSRAAVVVV